MLQLIAALYFVIFLVFQGVNGLEILQILPFYNRGFNSVSYEVDTHQILAKITTCEVEWTKSDIIVEIKFDCLQETCSKSFYLNGSDSIAYLKALDYQNLSIPIIGTTFIKRFYIGRKRKAGVAIFHFQINPKNSEGPAIAQYPINLLDPTKRYLESYCPSLITVQPTINIFGIRLAMDDYLPMGVPWEQITIFKRIRISQSLEGFIHLPLAILTRTPLNVTLFNFWSHPHVIFNFASNGYLYLKSSTATPMGYQDNGLYTMQWFIPDNQHLLMEGCPLEVTQGFPPPLAPLIAFINTSKTWSFNMNDFQQQMQSNITKEVTIACIMTDVFQELPKTIHRKYSLLSSHQAIYSSGDQLGFYVYAYKENMTSALLTGSECSSDYLGERSRFIPVIQSFKIMVQPVLVETGKTVQFSVRLESSCNILSRYWIVSITVYNSFNKTIIKKTIDSFFNVCQDPNKFFSFTITAPYVADVLRFVVQDNLNFHHRFAIVSDNHYVHVEPNNAIYDQMVTVTCFKEVLTILAQKTGKNRADFRINHIRSMELIGIREESRHLLVSLKAHNIFHVDRTRIYEFTIRNGTRPATWIELITEAKNLAPYTELHCRLQMDHQLIPEYSISNRKEICFIQMMHRIRLGVNNMMLPLPSKNKVQNMSYIQIQQASCVKPHVDLEIICSQFQMIFSCQSMPRHTQIFSSSIDVLIMNYYTKHIEVHNLVSDRPGQHTLTLKDISDKLHLSTVVCRQRIYPKDNFVKAVYLHFSVAAKLCVSALEFKFYNIRYGFDENKGLTFTQDQIFHSENVFEIIPETEIKLVEGSGIVCAVTTDERVVETYMTFDTAGMNFNIKRFKGQMRGFAIVPDIGNNSKLVDQALIGYCYAKRVDDNIISKSRPITFKLRKDAMDETKMSEFKTFMLLIICTFLTGLLLAALCPMLIIISMTIKPSEEKQKKKQHKKDIQDLMKQLTHLKSKPIKQLPTSEFNMFNLNRTSHLSSWIKRTSVVPNIVKSMQRPSLLANSQYKKPISDEMEHSSQ